MCFLFQVLLFAGVAACAEALHLFLNASLWAAGIGGFAFLGAAWFGYLLYQAKHPQWWPPWDEGLPQSSRMMNVFVPVVGIFLLILFMIPTFQPIMQKAKHHRMQHRHRGVAEGSVGLKSYAVGRRRLVSACADKEQGKH